MTQEGTLTSPSSSQVTEVVSAEPGAAACDTRPDVFQWDAREDCGVRQILCRIADKWSLLVISLLEEHTMRFGQLRREIDGISQRMLTVTLRNLERDGLIYRKVFPEIPPRVEYRLSPLGCTLIDTIQSLVRWADEHQEQIAHAREAFDAGDLLATPTQGTAPAG
jgi:DNA-binding HxlR family transcriptional regulator